MSTPQKKQWDKKRIGTLLTPILVLAGLLYTYRSHLTGCPRQVIVGVWAVAPPIWMYIEYLLLGRNAESPADWENFKYRQGLLRNFWIGMVALLSLLYLGRWD